jgi:hypothetical protein
MRLIFIVSLAAVAILGALWILLLLWSLPRDGEDL